MRLLAALEATATADFSLIRISSGDFTSRFC